MLVVTAYCGPQYFNSTRNLLEWIGELDPRLPHDLLLVTCAQTSMSDVMELDGLGKSIFNKCTSIKQKGMEDAGWPMTANSLWRTAVDWVTQNGTHFLWLEPDCVPMRSGWLNELEEEYKSSHKPIMGTVFDLPWKHINAVAIYPRNVLSINPYTKEASNLPFDVMRAEVTLRNAHVTRLIQRSLAVPERNQCHTFPDQTSLSVIHSDTALFHGCKDGTLIERLREQRPRPIVKVEKPSLLKSLFTKGDKLSDQTVIVQLGRLGDIMNVLPIAKNLSNKGQKPYFMVAKEFESILEGVSYVKPYVFDGPYGDLNGAMNIAKSTFGKVIKTQVYNPKGRQETLTDSWATEEWFQAGVLEHYNDKTWPLVFDRRDPKREQDLVARLFKTNKPKIITNLTAGFSVPFPNGKSVLGVIQQRFKDYEVVDVGNVRSYAVYDLLGMYEKAEVIVSMDTATLHLAAATDVPLVALVNPSGWLGPTPRYGCTARIPYTEATPDRVCQAIQSAFTLHSGKLSKPPKIAAKRLDLSRVTLWACCWSNDTDNLVNTLRVLRYCVGLANFYEVLLFSFLPVPQVKFPIRTVQIPMLNPNSWNVFHTFNVPHFIKSAWAMSVHTDGFILRPDLWTDKFLTYDFLGAPWKDGIVGNGGFCLESKPFLLAKTQLPFAEAMPNPMQSTFGQLTIMPSDMFVCRHHRKLMESKGMLFAPTNIAARFSTEQTHADQPSFGWHGRVESIKKYEEGWKAIRESENL